MVLMMVMRMCQHRNRRQRIIESADRRRPSRGVEQEQCSARTVQRKNLCEAGKWRLRIVRPGNGVSGHEI